MDISSHSVVALQWRLQDTLGETLGESDAAVEFYMGGSDLLPRIQQALEGHRTGDELNLHLEPEDAFGDYDEMQVHLLPRDSLPDEVEEGMSIEGSALPAAAPGSVPREGLYTITEIYPQHVVIDGNHPLAGIALRLTLKIAGVRAATEAEVGQGSTGTGFFTVTPATPAAASIAPGSQHLH